MRIECVTKTIKHIIFGCCISFFFFFQIFCWFSSYFFMFVVVISQIDRVECCYLHSKVTFCIFCRVYIVYDSSIFLFFHETQRKRCKLCFLPFFCCCCRRRCVWLPQNLFKVIKINKRFKIQNKRAPCDQNDVHFIPHTQHNRHLATSQQTKLFNKQHLNWPQAMRFHTCRKFRKFSVFNMNKIVGCEWVSEWMCYFIHKFYIVEKNVNANNALSRNCTEHQKTTCREFFFSCSLLKTSATTIAMR